ncbi:MAG: hypothetical protein K6T57_15200 [Thermaceae bacterium]|nr:hypothetical protein [Thermaceae bacterium]
MRWLLRLLRSVPRALALGVLLLAALAALGVLLWSLEHPRPTLTLLLLLGLVAYAYSSEGRRLLGDLHKW